MSSRVDNKADQKIAIVGMSCLFPGAPSIADFWMNIVNGVDSIRDATDAEWNPARHYNPTPKSFEDIYCKKGGFITELVDFDPVKHGVMPKTISGADPDQFLALRVAAEALADAGYSGTAPVENKYDVILGRTSAPSAGMMNMIQTGQTIKQVLDVLTGLHPEYTPEQIQIVKEALQSSLRNCNSDTIPALMPNVLAGRISGRFGFNGRNLILDAACASSLTAVELGVRGLLSGQSDMVLAGGIHVNSFACFYQMFCGLGALSHKEQIRPFDEEADGTMLGEGLGMVVLKRLGDAVRDGNRIYATICGIGTSSDGQGTSMLAPSIDGEALAFSRAYEMAGVSPKSIELLEAHGTGTATGDAVEMQAVEKVFGSVPEGEKASWCAIGGVKSMIGHTQAASGVAGLIKTALALYHKIIPKTLHVTTPTTAINWQKSPCYVSSETRTWIHAPLSGNEERRGAVSAFGFGGVNAHAVLEEYNAGEESKQASLLLNWPTELCLFGGSSTGEIAEQLKSLQRYLEINPSVALRSVAYTLCNLVAKKANVLVKLAIIAVSVDDLREKITAALASGIGGDAKITFVSSVASASTSDRRSKKLALVLPGASTATTNMFMDLCMHFPEVRSAFDEADHLALSANARIFPSKILFPRPFVERYSHAETAKVNALAAVMSQRGLHALFRQLEIEPDAVLGCDEGSLSALLISNAVRFEDVSKSLFQWSKGIAAVSATTVSLGLDQELGQPKVPVWSAVLDAGEPERLGSELTQALGKVSLSVGKSFNETVQCMHDDGIDTFVDFGTLGRAAKHVSDSLGQREHVSVAIDEAETPALTQFQRCLAQLFVRDVKMNLSYLFTRRSADLLDFAQTAAKAKSRTEVRIDLKYPTLVLDKATAARVRAMSESRKSETTAKESGAYLPPAWTGPKPANERNQDVSLQRPPVFEVNLAHGAPAVRPDEQPVLARGRFKDDQLRVSNGDVAEVAEIADDAEKLVWSKFFSGITEFQRHLNQTQEAVMTKYLSDDITD